jgi:hypothetical protein
MSLGKLGLLLCDGGGPGPMTRDGRHSTRSGKELNISKNKQNVQNTKLMYFIAKLMKVVNGADDVDQEFLCSGSAYCKTWRKLKKVDEEY